MTNPYFDELAQLLRDRGLPAEQVSRTVDDLAAFVAESGTDPVQEFGTPEEFAPQVAPMDGADPSADGSAPPATAETWTWRADAFNEQGVLNRYGDEGWEVERVDGMGRFVSHRAPENPQRWEYRRETVLPSRSRAVTDRLAPDGWEPCGTWICFEYFKRPKAATIGPEAELRSVPETPAGRTFLSKRFYLFTVVYGCLVAAVYLVGVRVMPGNIGAGFTAGVVLGSLLLLGAVAVRAWRGGRSRTS